MLWEVLVFLLHASDSLRDFIANLISIESPPLVSYAAYSDAITAVARLPLYSFDELHPFAETKIIITVDEYAKTRLDSGLYGAISSKWKKNNDGTFGNNSAEYAGDGVSKQFKLVSPKTLNLQHWD